MLVVVIIWFVFIFDNLLEKYGKLEDIVFLGWVFYFFLLFFVILVEVGVLVDKY